MATRTPQEKKHEVLEMLKQGYRSTYIHNRTGLDRNTIKHWQYLFDQGDTSWVEGIRRPRMSLDLRALAVKLVGELNSIKGAARELGVWPLTVRNAIRHSAATPADNPDKAPAEPVEETEMSKSGTSPNKKLDRENKHLRAAFESLLETCKEEMAVSRGCGLKKNIFLIEQLQRQLQKGYLPELPANFSVSPGAPITTVLEELIKNTKKTAS